MRDLTAERRAPAVCAASAVRELPPAACYVLRGDASVRAAAGQALGLSVPELACRASVAGARAALWLGPDEWLLLIEAPAAAALGAALASRPHSLVDVGHRQGALEVSGPQATLLLGAGCPLDLDVSAFPVGMCTRTMLGKAEVVLWRTAAEVFRVEVWRSFMAYVAQFLAEAARGII